MSPSQFIFSLVIFGFCTCSMLSHASAAQNFALVVGIGDYENFNDLEAPANDAKAIAGKLRDLGYQVDRVKSNAPTKEVLKKRWAKLLDSATQDSVLLFYYSGHGLSFQGRNWLVGANAPRDPASIPALSFSVDTLMSEMGAVIAENYAKAGIFIIDACRNMVPTIQSGREEKAQAFLKFASMHSSISPSAASEGNSEVLPGGLLPVLSPKSQMFVMYSAGSEQEAIARNGPNGKESVFTDHLLFVLDQAVAQRKKNKADNKNIDGKLLSLADMAETIRFRVFSEVRNLGQDNPALGDQTPAYYDELNQRLTITGSVAKVRSKVVTKFPKQASWLGSIVGEKDSVVECNGCPELRVLRASKQTSASSGRIAIGRAEITNANWNKCVADKVFCQGFRSGSGGHPVTGVSYEEALIYIAWLNSKFPKCEKEICLEGPYRLPSEAEWLYAARAMEKTSSVTKTKYHFGDSVAKLCEYANGADRSVYSIFWVNSCDDGVGRRVASVGSYRANAWGLVDMHGNVWEWTSDCEDKRSGSAGAEQTMKSCAGRRAVRGGSWRSGPTALELGNSRKFLSPRTKRSTVGFRVVRNL